MPYFSLMTPFRVWYISQPILMASLNEDAPKKPMCFFLSTEMLRGSESGRIIASLSSKTFESDNSAEGNGHQL